MKKRLDLLLVEKGLVTGRDKARAVVMAGLVYVDGQRADKAGAPVDEAASVELRGGGLKYVSRGGLKLEKAMNVFAVSLEHAVCMDIGASTGGFTDCMLQNGAAKVYAIDVGYGQLAWNLRQDERVIVMERTNIRYVTRDSVPDEIDFASVDISFISIKLALPVAYRLLKDSGSMICLIKPQFEAGRGKIGKKGVVRDIGVHLEVVSDIIAFTLENGFSVLGLDFSPIKGPEGNIEYLMHIKKTGQGETPVNAVSGDSIARVVGDSHAQLEGV